METIEEYSNAPQEEHGSSELEEVGSPAWMTTFGDMMSLLLTFFILLFSMSELKMDRFLLANQSLREAMGSTAETPVDDPMGLMPDPVDPDKPLQNPSEMDGSDENDGVDLQMDALAERMAERYMEDIARRLRDFIDENELHEILRVDHEADGVYLRIQAAALFASGDATMNDSSRWILEHLSNVVQGIDVRVNVIGHADNVPITSGVFPSNWELSAARAAGVARALVSGGQSPEMTRVEAFGEHRPVADNGTADGRAQNRRVELFYAWRDVLEMAMEWARASRASDAGQ